MKKRKTPVKVSSGAGLHPYMQKGFVFESKNKAYGPNMGPIMSDEEFEHYRKEITKHRTFYFNENIIRFLENEFYGSIKIENIGSSIYFAKGFRLQVDKDIFIENSIVKNNLDEESIKRWKEIPKQKITLTNNGTSWWTVESSFIKMM